MLQHAKKRHKCKEREQMTAWITTLCTHAKSNCNKPVGRLTEMHEWLKTPAGITVKLFYQMAVSEKKTMDCASVE